jgi:hypothetical protein
MSVSPGRRTFGRAIVIVALTALAQSVTRASAARDPAPKAAIATIEIVIYEDPASPYCQMFRRDVVPNYTASTRARRVPLRFIDITSMPSDTPGLARPIEIVPTAVVMQEGSEVGRVVGFWGSDEFARLIGQWVGHSE